jgi:hypothetical protein
VYLEFMCSAVFRIASLFWTCRRILDVNCGVERALQAYPHAVSRSLCTLALSAAHRRSLQRSTQHTAHSTQHTAHSTQHTAHSTQHTAHLHSAPSTQHPAPSTHSIPPYSTQHPAHSTPLHTAPSIQHPAPSKHTAMSKICDVDFTNFAFDADCIDTYIAKLLGFGILGA